MKPISVHWVPKSRPLAPSGISGFTSTRVSASITARSFLASSSEPQ
jgi:hypothetical protein